MDLQSEQPPPSIELPTVTVVAQDAVPPLLTTRAIRFWALFSFLLSLCLISLAIWLRPNPHGYGTHQQLGFGECGWLIATGLPCPSCGMTTAFAYTVRGNLGHALYAQPTGFLLAILAIVTIPVSFWSLVTGRPPRIRLPWLTSFQWFWLGLLIFLGGWGFKIAVGLLDGSLPLKRW